MSSSKYTKKENDDSGKRKIVKSYSVLIDEYKEIAEARNTAVKETQQLQKQMQVEFHEYSKKKSDELKRMKSMIKSLKAKCEGASKGEISVSKYNKLKENFKIAVSENEQLNEVALKLKDQVEDLTQKKNRMNFLIFLCMREGYPVTKLYKEQVKPIDSHRFDLLTPSKLKNSIKKMNSEIIPFNGAELIPENFFDEVEENEFLNKTQEYATYRSIGLNGSYEAIVEGPPLMPKKTSLVPTLDFNKLNEYNKAVKLAKKKKQQEKLKQGEIDELGSLLNSA